MSMFITFFFARQPPLGQNLLIHEVSRSHTTTHHSRQDFSGRVISSSQRPLPDNIQPSQQTSMPPVEFEPTISAGERPQTYALDCAATGTGFTILQLCLTQNGAECSVSLKKTGIKKQANRGSEDKRTGLHTISGLKHLGYLTFKFIPSLATRTYTHTHAQAYVSVSHTQSDYLYS